ncbi:MAG: uroporphyrinogen decarboxylase family protein [Candidatus Omnitrophica bacterium]|nr:uroporphyrinogen decarboxylase family protein [Candidatus Omnitrophota bacterium]MCM8769705.1 uroporphyrinogen decarboxylase family protein [Candidatus Omnitrophota bacterium]
MKKNCLSPRERVNLALAHQETDRIPIAMVCAGINEPARQNLEDHLQTYRRISLAEYLNSLLDIRTVSPRYVGPALPPGTDLWGVKRQPVAAGLARYEEIVYYPLGSCQTIDDLKRYRWPTTSFFDYQAIAQDIQQLETTGQWAIMVANGNIFETAWYMRGLDKLLLDFMTEPELAEYLLTQVADFMVDHFQKMLAAGRGRIDLAFTADDLAGQNGLLISPFLWERFIKPHHVRLNQVIHNYGARVIYHSDGAVISLVEGLIDMGIDILQSLQFDATGMDPVYLKERFGHRLCFQGGVSVQKTLPFGTPDEVKEEVKKLISILGKGGGYILGPSHSIQAGTPPENILAMFDTALSFYPFR